MPSTQNNKVGQWAPVINATLPARYFHQTTRIIRQESQTMIEVHSIRVKDFSLTAFLKNNFALSDLSGLVFGLRPEPPQRCLLAPCRESKQFQCWVGTSVTAYWKCCTCRVFGTFISPMFKIAGFLKVNRNAFFLQVLGPLQIAFLKSGGFLSIRHGQSLCPLCEPWNSDPRLHNKLALQQRWTNCIFFQIWSVASTMSTSSRNGNMPNPTPPVNTATTGGTFQKSNCRRICQMWHDGPEHTLKGSTNHTTPQFLATRKFSV